MFQEVTIAGYIGRDCELRFTPQGKPVGNFSLAAKSGWGDYEATAWFKVTVWDKMAESLSPYLLKGKQVMVIGELQVDPDTGGPRMWVGNDGATKSSFEITARKIVLLGGPGQKETDEEESEPNKEDNDIPF